MPDDVVEIDQTNWADDPDTAGQALTFLQEALSPCRSDRSAFDSDCRSLYNLWDAKRDIHYYRGRASLYLPSAHKAIERASAKQLARLIPSGNDFFDVQTMPHGMEESEEIAQDLDAAKALMSYDLQKCVKLRKWILPFLRQLNILGTSPSALDYVTQEEINGLRGRSRYRLAKRKDENGVGFLGGQQSLHTEDVGPTGRPVDLFTWYLWPSTVDEITDALVVFEDQLVSEAVLMRWRAAGRYAFKDGDLRAHAGKSPQFSIWSSFTRLQERGISITDPDNNLYVLTTAYALWSPENKKGVEPFAHKFSCINDALCIEARQNPWWHQEAPYHVGRLNRYIGEFYGRGLCHFTRSIQYLINDVANQTLDGVSYTLNPIACVDPDFPDPDLLQYRPGAKWPIDPKKVFFLQIPDKSAQGFGVVRQLYEFSQDVSGASTGGMYQPTLGIARGAETATGQSLLIAQGDIEVNLITSSLEEEWLEPQLAMIDSMEQQFLPIQGERTLRALGPKGLPLLRNGMQIRRDQMLGTRTYVWTGSAISEQREVFQKHGADMLKIMAQLKQANDPDYTINLAPFIKDLYRSYGFPNADQIIQLTEPGEGFDADLEHAVMAVGWPADPRWGEPYLEHLQAHNTALPAARQAGWGKRLEAHMHKTLAMMQKAGAKAAMGGAGGPSIQPPGGPPGAVVGPNGQPMPPSGPPAPPGISGQPGAPQGPPMPPPGVQQMNPAIIAMLRARQQGGGR